MLEVALGEFADFRDSYIQNSKGVADYLSWCSNALVTRSNRGESTRSHSVSLADSQTQ